MSQSSKIPILSTPGGEFISLVTKKEYVGLYRYERGLPFMGAEAYGNEARLYDIRFGDVYNSSAEDILTGGIEARTYTQLKPKFGQHLNDPPAFRARPTEKDYIQTRIYRYFIKNLHTGRITEGSKLTYKAYSLKDTTLKNIYEAIKIQWKIAGPLNNLLDSNGTIVRTGIIQTNKKTMDLHKEKFPEFSLVIPPDDLAKITS